MYVYIYIYIYIYIYLRIFKYRQSSNFFVLCQMSKYFAKCFGPSTQVPKFLTQIP